MTYVLSFRSPYAGEPLDFSERGRADQAQREATFNAIVRLLSTPRRQPARHRYHPLTLACLDCGVAQVANDAIAYGDGLKCAEPPA